MRGLILGGLLGVATAFAVLAAQLTYSEAPPSIGWIVLRWTLVVMASCMAGVLLGAVTDMAITWRQMNRRRSSLSH